RLPTKLDQGRGGAPRGLGALAAAQPAGEIVHEGVGGCSIAARSTSLGVLQRAHLIYSQGKPPFTAWSIVGDGSIGSPSDHMLSFQLSRSNLSACWISASPLARISADWAARMLAIARALPSSFRQSLEIAARQERRVI